MEARKLEVDLAYHRIDWAEADLRADGDIHFLLDKDEELDSPFKYLVTSIYMSTICYLDAKKLHEYLKIFYRQFGGNPENIKDRDNFEFDHYHSGQPYNVFLSKIHQFLSVFDFLNSDHDRYKRLSGIQYLEAVLNNTASIVSNTKITPKSETEVYNAVKHVLAAIFPSSINPKSNFIKTFKAYNPDILIPELNVAIEYKYANTENKLKTTIEQIAADVNGYTGDKDYDIFYAVFYVTEDFWGEDKFKKHGKNKNFRKTGKPTIR